MRFITFTLMLCLVLIQYPLWLGKGSWLYVHRERQNLIVQQKKTQSLKQANQQLEGEIDDLQKNVHAAEESARYELGVIKPGEIFVQFVTPAQKPAQEQKNKQ